MREHIPVLVTPFAGQVLCNLTKHQVIDMLIHVVYERMDGDRPTESELIERIEEIAKVVLPQRDERPPKLMKLFTEDRIALGDIRKKERELRNAERPRKPRLFSGT